MMFNYDNKNYSFSDTLDPVEVHDNLFIKAISAYKTSTQRISIEKGIKEIKISDLSQRLYLTGVGMDNFLLSILYLCDNGWQLTNPVNTSSSNYIHSVMLERKQSNMKKDIEVVSKTIPEKVKSYMEGFEIAKEHHKVAYAESLELELAEIQKAENYKNELRQKLKEISK